MKKLILQSNFKRHLHHAYLQCFKTPRFKITLGATILLACLFSLFWYGEIDLRYILTLTVSVLTLLGLFGLLILPVIRYLRAKHQSWRFIYFVDVKGFHAHVQVHSGELKIILKKEQLNSIRVRNGYCILKLGVLNQIVFFTETNRVVMQKYLQKLGYKNLN